MFFHYFKTTFRSFWSNKVNFFINLTNLAIGMTACLALFLWVQKEHEVNSYLPDKDRVMQVITNYSINGSIQSVRATSHPIVQTIESEIYEVEGVAFMQVWEENHVLSIENNKEIKATGRLLSSNFFQVIARPFLFGSAESALKSPLSIVISSSLASKLFGESWKDKIGNQTLLIDQWKEMDISGVFEDFPETSTVRFEYGILLRPAPNEFIGNYNFDTYVKLFPGHEVAEVQDKINALLSPHARASLVLQPFSDIYLYSNFQDGKANGGRIEYVNLFTGAAIFILLMACINFMNLYTASSFKRTKEIGMKQIIGARRNSLIWQLMLEAYLTITLSLALSLIILFISVPRLNEILGINLKIPYGSITFWLSVLLFSIITALLAGLYPSSLLTSFKPIQIIRANQDIKIGGVGIRKALFIFQFLVSVLLVFFTFGVMQQLQYLKNKNLGFNKSNILCKKISPEERFKLDVLKNEIKSNPAFLDVTSSSSSLLQGSPMAGGIKWPNMSNLDSTRFGIIFIDDDFIKTLNIPTAERAQDGAKIKAYVPVFLNEAAADIMGGADNILNQTIRVWDSEGRVVGIVKDFHFNSLFNPIEPLIMANLPNQAEYLFMRVKEGSNQEALNFLSQLHASYSPNKIFSYYWMEDSLHSAYKNEFNAGTIASLFAVISIIISSLGLLGLTNFSVKRRTRELSIRKVLGADFKAIFLQIFGDFGKLILIGILCGIPIAYYFFSNWLDRFVFKIGINASLLVIPALSLFTTAFIIIVYYSIKVNFTNPVKTLKNE